MQHRAMPVRQQKRSRFDPLWIYGFVAHVHEPQGVGYFRHSHGHAWVTGIGFLYGIHGQCANSARKVFE